MSREYEIEPRDRRSLSEKLAETAIRALRHSNTDYDAADLDSINELEGIFEWLLIEFEKGNMQVFNPRCEQIRVFRLRMQR